MTSTTRHKLKPLAAAIGLLLTLPAQAVPVDWIGSTGSWDVADNWNPGIPGVTDDVTINVPGAQTVAENLGNGAVAK